MQLLSTTAHYKPALIVGQLPGLLPQLYEQTVINEALIRTVDLGPFKHKIDDGLELRKAAFECMDVLLDNCQPRLDMTAFIHHLESGLKVWLHFCGCVSMPSCSDLIHQFLSKWAQPSLQEVLVLTIVLNAHANQSCAAGPLRREDAGAPAAGQAGDQGARPRAGRTAPPCRPSRKNAHRPPQVRCRQAGGMHCFICYISISCSDSLLLQKMPINFTVIHMWQLLLSHVRSYLAQVDRNEDMLRSCLRAIVELQRMPNVQTCAPFKRFMESTVLTGPMATKYAAVKEERAEAEGIDSMDTS